MAERAFGRRELTFLLHVRRSDRAGPGEDATCVVDSSATSSGRASTGIPGLDDILGGGLTPDRFYLVEGTPGTGKTTLALQFLMEGVRLGEPALYITLSETADELRAVAESARLVARRHIAVRARERERTGSLRVSSPFCIHQKSSLERLLAR